MSSLHTPTVEGSYRIMPSDINTMQPFRTAFGKAEVEWVALGLVLFCQDKGEWATFTEQELTEHFRVARAAGRAFPYEAFDVFGPVGPGGRMGTKTIDAYCLFMSDHEAPIWSTESPDTFKFFWLSPEEGLLVRKGDDGKYRVTELFIERCLKASPAHP